MKKTLTAIVIWGFDLQFSHYYRRWRPDRSDVGDPSPVLYNLALRSKLSQTSLLNSCSSYSSSLSFALELYFPKHVGLAVAYSWHTPLILRALKKRRRTARLARVRGRNENKIHIADILNNRFDLIIPAQNCRLFNSIYGPHLTIW